MRHTMRHILTATLLAGLAPAAGIASPAVPGPWQAFERICRARGNASPAEVAARLERAGWTRVEDGAALARGADLYGSLWTLQDFRITPETASAATLHKTHTEMADRFRMKIAKGTAGGERSLGLLALSGPGFHAYTTYTIAARNKLLETYPCDVEVLGKPDFLAARFSSPDWVKVPSRSSQTVTPRPSPSLMTVSLEAVSRAIVRPANAAAAGLTLSDYKVTIAPVPQAGG